jgi:hypothetical protein
VNGRCLTHMSPELAFILSLALRMAVSAAFVVGASIVTERAGPAIGALVATLPISAGPSYIFLALDHGAPFIAQGALASLPMNAATILMCLVVANLALRFGTAISLGVGLGVWLFVALMVRLFDWTLAGGIALNVVVLGICLPLARRFRVVKMPLITRRWYDIPLRAALVASLIASVVALSNIVGPRASGMIALFPVVFSSLVLSLMPRIGGPATAALLANGQFGMIGFGVAVVVLHLAALPLGSAAALSLALATCVGWNAGLWLFARRRRRTEVLDRA